MLYLLLYSFSLLAWPLLWYCWVSPCWLFLACMWNTSTIYASIMWHWMLVNTHHRMNILFFLYNNEVKTLKILNAQCFMHEPCHSFSMMFCSIYMSKFHSWYNMPPRITLTLTNTLKSHFPCIRGFAWWNNVIRKVYMSPLIKRSIFQYSITYHFIHVIVNRYFH